MRFIDRNQRAGADSSHPTQGLEWKYLEEKKPQPKEVRRALFEDTENTSGKNHKGKLPASQEFSSFNLTFVVSQFLEQGHRSSLCNYLERVVNSVLQGMLIIKQIATFLHPPASWVQFKEWHPDHYWNLQCKCAIVRGS